MLTAALVEPHREPTSPDTRAAKDGQAHRLTGRKHCVPAGPIADAILVPAAVEGGVGVFLVESGAAGVRQTPLATTSQQPESLLELDGARGELLGSVAEGARDRRLDRVARDRGALRPRDGRLLARRSELTAEYTKTRKQFDQPIATFQAVGQRAADAFIDTEGVRLTALQAAWRIDAGLPAEAAVAEREVLGGPGRLARRSGGATSARRRRASTASTRSIAITSTRASSS